MPENTDNDDDLVMCEFCGCVIEDSPQLCPALDHGICMEEHPPFHPADLPPPICDYCGHPITEYEQECMARDDATCAP